MKMYSIRKGTEAIVLRDWAEAEDGKMKSKQHHTTKDLSFFDTLVDPVWIANGNQHKIAVLNSLASIGYAVFVDMDAPDYALAVMYKNVAVS